MQPLSLPLKIVEPRTGRRTFPDLDRTRLPTPAKLDAWGISAIFHGAVVAIGCLCDFGKAVVIMEGRVLRSLTATHEMR